MKSIIIDETIKALIFDCDGTLVDSMPLHMKAWEESFNYFNEKYQYDFLFSLKGMKETDIIKLYNNAFGSEIDPDAIVSVKHHYFEENINEVKPIELITNIARNTYGILPMAVVSGGIKKIIQRELEVIGIAELFSVVLTADDPFLPKPAPDIFLAAAEQLNILPEFCLVFEDGDSGILAAQRANMKTLDVRDYF